MGDPTPDFANKSVRRSWFLKRMRRSAPSFGKSVATLMTLARTAVDFSMLDEFSGLDYSVVGGVATRSYQPERFTKDLDLLVSAAQIDLVRKRLHEHGFEKVGGLTFPDSALGLDGETWQRGAEAPLGIMRSSQVWATAAISGARPDAQGLPIVSLAHLILMKLDASRGVDQGDLSRMLGLADDASLENVRAVIAALLPDAVENLEHYIELGRFEVGRAAAHRPEHR